MMTCGNLKKEGVEGEGGGECGGECEIIIYFK
jgi:hypothetical protein